MRISVESFLPFPIDCVLPLSSCTFFLSLSQEIIEFCGSPSYTVFIILQVLTTKLHISPLMIAAPRLFISCPCLCLCFVWRPSMAINGSVCVCVCVFFPSILDIKFVGRTSRGHTGGRSHRIFNPPSFCGACLDFCREKDSAIPFPRRP